MNKIGKFLAVMMFISWTDLLMLLNGIGADDWRYWIISLIPTFGGSWIVEKLDKIK